MPIVYLLWFVQGRKEEEDTELLIGVYANEEAAKAAIEHVKKPGKFLAVAGHLRLQVFHVAI